MRADVRAPTNSLTDAQIMIRLLFECRYNEMLSKELHHLVNLSSSAEVRVRMVDRPPRTSTIISRSRVYMAATGDSAQSTFQPR